MRWTSLHQVARLPVVEGYIGLVSDFNRSLVRVLRYAPESVELEVRVPGERPAVLASTERHAPAWTAAVDGIPQRVAMVNYFFRGVRLQPGLHRVVFDYRPRFFGVLLASSYSVIVASIAIAAAVLVRRRRDHPGL